MDQGPETWWRDEFSPASGRGRIHFVSRDGKTVVDVERSPQGMRGLYAGIMRLALFAAHEPTLKQACLVIDATRLSRERLVQEWRNIKGLFSTDLAKRLSLVAVGREGTWVEPEDPYLRRIANVFEPSPLSDTGARSYRRALKPMAGQRYFEVVKVLLVRWLRKTGPTPVGRLAQEVGCTYPTVREALNRLANKQYLKRHSSRAVELARFPHDTWSEMVALSSGMRRSIRFVDVSGDKPDPQRLTERLDRIRPPHIAVGGVVAARFWHRNFDLHGMPRLDLVLHAPDFVADLGFVKRLDPALRETDAHDGSPVLAIHPLLRSDPFFESRSEGELPVTDPIETALDLLELGLTVQAGQLLGHFRSEIRLA